MLVQAASLAVGYVEAAGVPVDLEEPSSAAVTAVSGNYRQRVVAQAVPHAAAAFEDPCQLAALAAVWAALAAVWAAAFRLVARHVSFSWPRLSSDCPAMECHLVTSSS